MVHESNLNFHLMNKYLAFLLDNKYLERTPNGSYETLKLTDKGARLLSLLDELQTEIKEFGTRGLRREAIKGTGELLVRSEGSREMSDWLRMKRFLRSDQEYQISLALIQLYSLRGEVSNELVVIERMLTLAQALTDTNRLAEAHATKSNHLARVGLYQNALLEGQRALEFASAAGDDARVAAAKLAIGEASAFLGQRNESLRDFLDALGYYQEQGDRVGQANAIRLIAQVHLKHGDFADALDHANRALTIFREIGDRVGEDETLRYVGDICCARGDFLQARDHYERVLKIRRDMGNRSREGGALGDIGDVYLSLGQYEKSLDLHRQALAIDTEVCYKFGQVWDHHDLGVTHHGLGSLTIAREELTIGQKQAKDIGAPDMIVLCDNDLSAVLRSIGGTPNLEGALQLASEASMIGEIYSLDSGQIIGESNMAMAYRALGSMKEALEHSDKAVRLLDGNGPIDVQEEEILYNHFLVLRDNQRQREANDYLGRAHSRVMSKADMIKDSATRKPFLTRVTVNREIASFWEDLKDGGVGYVHPTFKHPQGLS